MYSHVLVLIPGIQECGHLERVLVQCLLQRQVTGLGL